MTEDMRGADNRGVVTFFFFLFEGKRRDFVQQGRKAYVLSGSEFAKKKRQ